MTDAGKAGGTSRREFVTGAGAGVVALTSSSSAMGARSDFTKERDPKGPIWIDALSGLDGLPKTTFIEQSAFDALATSSLSMFSMTVANTPGPPGTASHTFDEAIEEIGRWNGRFARYPDKLLHMKCADDILKARRSGRAAVLLNFQNSTHIKGNLSNLDLFYHLGIRQMQLTYNSLNNVGCGCTERTDAGLSYFGVDVIARMNELGILLDLSHSNERTTLDAIAVAKKPLAITHTNCRALRNHPRCKTDEEIRKVAATGGVVGITTYGTYISSNVPVTVDDFIRHVEHAVKLVGPDHVGIGTDAAVQYVTDYPKSEAEFQAQLARPTNYRPVPDAKWNDWIEALNGPAKFQTIADALKQRGFVQRDIDKILGGNFLRLYRDTIG